jgi:hypothetical protein
VDLVSVLQESLQHAGKPALNGKRKTVSHKRKLKKAA